MPFSKRPRRPRGEPRGPNPFTRAGTLLYSWYEAAMYRKLEQRDVTIETTRAHARRRTKAWRTPGADSREAKRRVRQGAHLSQHPSVLERFANHPTRAQIEETVREVEKKTGLVAGAKRAISRLKPKPAVA